MSDWTLSTSNVLQPYTPTFVANGYLGASGDWLGLGPSDCHLVDLYNRASNPADTVRARLPAFNGLDLHNGRHWLGGVDRNTTLIRDYAQELDLRTALLTTRFRWHDGDHLMDVAVRTFISRRAAQLAVQQITITPLFEGTARLRVFVDERRGDLLCEQAVYDPLSMASPESADLSWVLPAAPVQRDRTIAIATALRLEGFGAQLQSAPTEAPDQSGVLLTFQAQAGTTATLTRYVVVGDELPDDALARAHAGRASGFDALFADHAADWAELWQGAITIEDDGDAQRVIRSAQYALLSSLRAGSGQSISPMGLSSRGYGGHIFWDADTWIYPGVLLTHPELAQGCVEYRCDRLEGARDKARQFGYAGAMFPWESDDLGVETTPDWAPCGRYEQHITACVALAAWQWWQATEDRDWLRARGWPLLRECATFWASRVEPAPQPDNRDPELRYHIRDVQAADEYALRIDDNAWTNASAARSLEIAAQAAALLDEPAPPEWTHVAARLHIPFDEQRRITLEHASYADEIIKQADVVLLTFPLAWPLPSDVAANNARFYATRVDADHGPAMTYAIHAILAAAVGDQTLLDEYLRRSYEHNVRPPFKSFSETPDQEYCTFVTGAGALLQALIYGCCGARLADDGLTFPVPPLLPPGWTRLSMRLRCRGQHFMVEVTPGGRTVREVS